MAGKNKIPKESERKPVDTKRLIAVASASTIVAVLTLGIVTLWLGVGQVVFTTPGEEVVVYPEELCGSTHVERFNESVGVHSNNEFEALYREVSNYNNYEKDPNCLYIVMYYHLFERNFEEATEHYEIHKNMEERNIRPSHEFSFLVTKPLIEAQLTEIEENPDLEMSPLGDG